MRTGERFVAVHRVPRYLKCGLVRHFEGVLLGIGRILTRSELNGKGLHMQKIQLVCDGKPLGDPVDVEDVELTVAIGTTRTTRRIQGIVTQQEKPIEVHVSGPLPAFSFPRG